MRDLTRWSRPTATINCFKEGLSLERRNFKQYVLVGLMEVDCIDSKTSSTVLLRVLSVLAQGLRILGGNPPLKYWGGGEIWFKKGIWECCNLKSQGKAHMRF